MKTVFIYLAVALLWVLHWLPLPVTRAIGSVLGRLLYAFGRERREVARINLRLCFPDKSEDEIDRLARAHVIAFACAALDRVFAWWSSAPRLRRLCRVTGIEHLKDPAGRPVIMLCPHFVGLDAAATRLSMDVLACSVYSAQKNEVINRLLYRGRTRFNETILLSRQDGMRKIVKALKGTGSSEVPLRIAYIAALRAQNNLEAVEREEQELSRQIALRLKDFSDPAARDSYLARIERHKTTALHY